jgi:hypothetical protein
MKKIRGCATTVSLPSGVTNSNTSNGELRRNALEKCERRRLPTTM